MPYYVTNQISQAYIVIPVWAFDTFGWLVVGNLSISILHDSLRNSPCLIPMSGCTASKVSLLGASDSFVVHSESKLRNCYRFLFLAF